MTPVRSKTVVITAVLLVCALAAAVFTHHRWSRYEEARRLAEAGDTQGAYEIFTALGGYSDAAERARTARSSRGIRSPSAPTSRTTTRPTAPKRYGGLSSIESTTRSSCSAPTAWRGANTTTCPSKKSRGRTAIFASG